VLTDQPRDGAWSLPGYRLGEVLGRGGFATVYRARQLSLDRDVAVKVLTSDLATSGDRRRFERERRALSRLSTHPNVVEIHDAGITAENRPYLVMRLYPGGTLSDRLKERGPVPVSEVIPIVAAVADALDEAHGAGILHRDVKPSNVLVAEDGTPVLADFGIAGLLFPELDSSTVSTAFFSLAHVAPEILSVHQYSVASDVYALASTTYQLLAGQPPFPPTDPRIGSLILDEPPPALDVPGLPPRVGAAVLRAMAKDPGNRPQSAGEFARSLADAFQIGAETTATALLAPRPEPLAQPPTEPVLPPAQPPTEPVLPPAQPATLLPISVPPFEPASPAVFRSPEPAVSDRAVRSRRRSVDLLAAVAVSAMAFLLVGVGIARLGNDTERSGTAAASSDTDQVPVEGSPGSVEDSPIDDPSADSVSDGTTQPSPRQSAAGSDSYDVAAAPYCTHSDDLQPFTEVNVSAGAKTAEDGISYEAANLVDGKPSTAWVEGADGLGAGESVTFTFSRPVTVVTACLINGYAKSADLYQRNARARTVEVITDHETSVVGLTDLGLIAEPSTFQELPLPEKVVTRVTLRLRSFYGPNQLAGQPSYEDTCLSEVVFWYRPVDG
jgi:serine/threonine protein kinase